MKVVIIYDNGDNKSDDEPFAMYDYLVDELNNRKIHTMIYETKLTATLRTALSAAGCPPPRKAK